ncbi:hypothetical protein [Streptomyces sp. NPDC006012]|uniref:hypothetical protein n=1 Tax=Streptomyces sp. NPDC006012 TaxID=3364739 RepID=UPI0036C7B31A
MTTQITALQEIEKAQQFFFPEHTAEAAALAARGRRMREDKKPVDDIVKSVTGRDYDPMVNLQVSEEIDPKFATRAADIRYYLDAYGVISTAFVGGKATKDTSKVQDQSLWTEVYHHLPLLSMTIDAHAPFNYEASATELSTHLIKSLLGFSAGSDLVATMEFAGFMQSLGEGIRIESTKEQKDLTLTIPASYVRMTTGKDDVEGHLDLHLLNSSVAHKVYKTNCSSHESVQVSFTYSRFGSKFAYSQLSNPDIKKALDDFIAKQELDQIKKDSDWFNDGETKHKK